jgi:DNA-binding MarR family transcriptional regulator
LFTIAARALVDQLHDELRQRGWTDVRPSFGFVLLAVRSEPQSTTALAGLLGTSKQAASKLVGELEVAGYVVRTQADDARRKVVRLTPRGAQLLEAVEDIYADLEARWADVIGGPAVERLRRDLTTVLATDDGVLPPVRPV